MRVPHTPRVNVAEHERRVVLELARGRVRVAVHEVEQHVGDEQRDLLGLVLEGLTHLGSQLVVGRSRARALSQR